MSIRKRQWGKVVGHDDKGKAIRENQAWIVDYKDQEGQRHIKTFRRKHDADNYASRTRIDVLEGKHVADSRTVTVAQACDGWIKTGEQRKLEASTLKQYGQHANLHIKPLIGATKLSTLSVAFVRAFKDRLIEEGRSTAMAMGIVRSLGSIIADAQERGWIARNPVRELRRNRRGNSNGDGRRKLQVGVDIPTPQEIAAIIQKAQGLRAKASLMTFATTGVRASEFRGLRWTDLDLDKGNLHVRVRADFQNVIGPPKSKAGTRTIPMGPRLTRTLRLWELQCPKKHGELLYVFPNNRGNIESHSNLRVRLWWQAQLDAGVTTKDEEGKLVPKYTGVHALRHFYASWCLNRKRDGGLELPAKVASERLGHSSIQVTCDRYGHLFPPVNDHEEMKRAELELFGPAQERARVLHHVARSPRRIS